MMMMVLVMMVLVMMKRGHQVGTGDALGVVQAHVRDVHGLRGGGAEVLPSRAPTADPPPDALGDADPIRTACLPD